MGGSLLFSSLYAVAIWTSTGSQILTQSDCPFAQFYGVRKHFDSPHACPATTASRVEAVHVFFNGNAFQDPFLVHVLRQRQLRETQVYNFAGDTCTKFF